MKLEDLSRYLMAYLDGSWTCVAIQEVLEELIVEGVIDLRLDDRPLKESSQIKAALPEMLGSTLQALANAALLVT